MLSHSFPRVGTTAAFSLQAYATLCRHENRQHGRERRGFLHGRPCGRLQRQKSARASTRRALAELIAMDLGCPEASAVPGTKLRRRDAVGQQLFDLLQGLTSLAKQAQ